MQDLRLPARLSGRPGRPDHRLHGGLLHVSEILQSENHELMRILHLDAGREMRGGQWQVLRLIEGLAARGRGIHAAGARRRSAVRRRAQAGLARASRWASRRAIASLRDARPDPRARCAQPHAGRCSCAARRWWSSRRVAFPVGSRWKYGRARRYLAVSEFVKGVLMEGGVAEEKISCGLRRRSGARSSRTARRSWGSKRIRATARPAWG